MPQVGRRDEVRGASGPASSSPILFPALPHSSQAPMLGAGVEGVGRGRVVCASPKPGSCADESRLNGEPQAVLSRPTLTHLSPPPPKSSCPHLKVRDLLHPGGWGDPFGHWSSILKAGRGLKFYQVCPGLGPAKRVWFLWRRELQSLSTLQGASLPISNILACPGSLVACVSDKTLALPGVAGHLETSGWIQQVHSN